MKLKKDFLESQSTTFSYEYVELAVTALGGFGVPSAIFAFRTRNLPCRASRHPGTAIARNLGTGCHNDWLSCVRIRDGLLNRSFSAPQSLHLLGGTSSYRQEYGDALPHVLVVTKVTEYL